MELAVVLTPRHKLTKVNSSTTVISSSNDPQFTLKGLTVHSGGSTNFARLELKNASFSESNQGTYSTAFSGADDFDCLNYLLFTRNVSGTITSFNLRNVDLSVNRVQTVTIFLIVFS